MQVPEQGLAGVTDPSHDVRFAGAEGSYRHGVASTLGKEVLGDTIGVAVALLAARVVVALGCALLKQHYVKKLRKYLLVLRYLTKHLIECHILILRKSFYSAYNINGYYKL